LEYAGVAYENLSDRKHAVEYIGKAIAAGFPADKVKNDPELQELLKDPSFRLSGK
jgi:hypothetical protein